MYRNPALISLFLLIMGLFSSGNAFADSSVTIHNDMNTSSSNTSSSQCHTVIHMTVNGKEQDIESNDCNHDVNVTNGNNSIHISNGIGDNAMIQRRISTTVSPEVHPTMASEKQNTQKNMRHTQGQMLSSKKTPAQYPETFLSHITAWFHDIFSGKW